MKEKKKPAIRQNKPLKILKMYINMLVTASLLNQTIYLNEFGCTEHNNKNV